MISELLLNFETNKSGKSFIIKDMSVYNTMLPITCTQLTVKVPGFSKAHTFEPLPNDDYPPIHNSSLEVWRHFWAADGVTDGRELMHQFTPLRQTIILFMAAMNDEL